MHRKAVFFLAGVFLAVALVVPTVLLVLQSESDLDKIINEQNPLGHQTSGNITLIEQISEGRQTTFMLVLVIEVIFVVLGVVTLYYGINHPHPKH
jgi:ABC-type sulfate transport system permease component